MPWYTGYGFFILPCACNVNLGRFANPNSQGIDPAPPVTSSLIFHSGISGVNLLHVSSFHVLVKTKVALSVNKTCIVHVYKLI